MPAEARPGPPPHRVPPAGLHLQPDARGLRAAARLRGGRGPLVPLPGGAALRLRRLRDQQHRVRHVGVKKPVHIVIVVTDDL